MNTPIACTAGSTLGHPQRASAALSKLNAIAARFAAWLAALRRSSHDRDALAGMSERDLRDIGLERCFDTFAHAWSRDLPR